MGEMQVANWPFSNPTYYMTLFAPQILHTLYFSNALWNTQPFQKHWETECTMGDSRIDGKYNSGGSYRFVFYTHLYSIVLDVKVTGGSSEVCWVKVAGSLIKPDHLCFVQMTRCVCDQVSPMLMQKGIFLCKTHVKNDINFVAFYYLSEGKWRLL